MPEVLGQTLCFAGFCTSVFPAEKVWIALCARLSHLRQSRCVVSSVGCIKIGNSI